MTSPGKTWLEFKCRVPCYEPTIQPESIYPAILISGLSVCLSPSRETYNALTNWLTDARTLASPNIVIILCGNKKDLEAEREVTFLEASRFAQENGNVAWPPTPGRLDGLRPGLRADG